MSILITGGAGYIGSHTAVELLNAGRDIVVVDNFSNSKPCVIQRVKKITGKDFPFYQVDLLDECALKHIFDENDIKSVIHFAGLKAVGESVEQPLRYYSHNLNVTFNLCREMAEHNVGNIVFSSSATVYGNPASVPIKESFPLSTTNPYGETKLMIERILDDVRRAGLLSSVSILRYFNPIGAHESGLIGEDPCGVPNNLLPFITQVAAGRLATLRIFGDDYPTHDGTGVRDYIHVVDLARAHIKALDRCESVSGTEYYNIGTGKGYSVLDIVRAYEQVTGRNVPYEIVGRRPGDIAECYADPSLAEAILGWRAEYDIIRMCRDSDRWQTMNPNGYEA